MQGLKTETGTVRFSSFSAGWLEYFYYLLYQDRYNRGLVETILISPRGKTAEH